MFYNTPYVMKAAGLLLEAGFVKRLLPFSQLSSRVSLSGLFFFQSLDFTCANSHGFRYNRPSFCSSYNSLISSAGCHSTWRRGRGCRAGRRVKERKQARAITTLVTDHQRDSLKSSLNNRGVNHHHLVHVPSSSSGSKQNCLLKVTTINCESSNNKSCDLVDYILDQHIDICCLTETWLHPDDYVTPKEIHPKGFDIISNPRMGRLGGGVAVVYNTNLKAEARKSTSYTSFEHVITEVSHPEHSTPFLFVVVYRPPRSPKNCVPMSVFFEEITNLLTELVTQTGRLVITGDFNIHVDVADDGDAIRFLDILDSLDLFQHVSEPTHRLGHTLDLVITSKTTDLNLGSTPRPHYWFSTHATVLYSLNMNKFHPAKKSVNCRRLKSLNTDKLKTDISSLDLCTNQYTSVDEFVSSFHAALSDILDHHAPVVKVIIPDRKSQPWYNSDVSCAKKSRRQAERRWRKSRLETDRLIFIKEREKVSRLIAGLKQSYLVSLVEGCKGDQKALFQMFNRLLHKQTTTPLPKHSSSKKLADSFMSFFSGKIENIKQKIRETPFSDCSVPDCCSTRPLSSSLKEFSPVSVEDVVKLISSSKSKSCPLDSLPTLILKQCLDVLAPIITRMISFSLCSGSVPTLWKQALITPTLKKPGSDLVCKNYRPVSNLNFIAKICEKVVAAQFCDYVNTHNLGEAFQSAYKKGHSTETALVRVFNDILHAIDNRKVTILVLLDLSAAFDTVDHKILLQRLQHNFGIGGSVLDWFEAYLRDRCERVIIHDEKSYTHEVTCGVPQGSVLGPILFLVYMSPLGDTIRKHNLNLHFYADDSQIYLSFESGDPQDQERASVTVNNALQDIREWMTQNSLLLNDDKTELMLIGTQQQLVKVIDSPMIQIGETSILPSKKARNLGIVLDQNLKLLLHVNNIIKSSIYHLRNIAKIRKYLTLEASVSIVRALVISRLDYCNALLYGLPKCLLSRLQYVQNCAARLVYRSGFWSSSIHVTPMLRELHWLPVEARIEFKVCLLVFKTLNGLAPPYLSELINRHPHRRSGLRSQSSNNLIIPRMKSRAERSMMDRAFSVCGPKLWNALPETLKSTTSLPIFKKYLKTHLFKKYYL